MCRSRCRRRSCTRGCRRPPLPAAPSEVSRPTVVSPSLSSTITPGADVGVLGVGGVHEQFGSGRQARRRSPSTRRVRGCRCRSPSHRDRASGSTSTLTWPENEISPTSTSGSTDRRSRAPPPGRRRIGSDRRRRPPSTATRRTTRGCDPRSCVRSVSRSTGRAMAITATVSPSSCTPATTCRRQRGPLRRDTVEQVDLGEADGRGPAPPQHDDVQHGECHRDDQQPEPAGFEEVGTHSLDHLRRGSTAVGAGLRCRMIVAR